jgi:AraC family transcriptional regulator, transcriptional activator of pobA
MKRVPVLDIKLFHQHDSVEDFYANTLENHLITRHKDISHPHAHNFYLAVLFTHGTGTHEVDFTTYAVKPGALFFLNPGQTHHWELSPDTAGYIILHTREFYELHYTHNRLPDFTFFYSMHNTPCLYLLPADNKRITALFEGIYTESHTPAPLKQNALLSLVDLVYTYSARLYPETVDTETDNSYYTKFRRFEALVEGHFRTEKSPSYYAGLMAVSPRHLNRMAQAVTGKTATDVILDRVLLEAKKELVLQRNSFANIAYALGYDDYAYFSRLFKNREGQTPSEFLSRYR